MLLLYLISQVVTQINGGEVMITNLPETAEIEACTPVDTPLVCNEYDQIIAYYCDLYCIDPALVKVLIEKESEFNPNAVSRSGAIGLMQLMPETAEMLGVKDPYNPWDNIEGGVKFLRTLFDMFDGDLELTLAAYHAGPGLVKRLNRVPPIPETVEYVDYIISRYTPAQRTSYLKLTFTEEGVPLITNRPK